MTCKNTAQNIWRKDPETSNFEGALLFTVIGFGLWLWAFVDGLQPFPENADSFNRIGETLQMLVIALPGIFLMGCVSLWLLISQLFSLATWNRRATIATGLIGFS